MARPPRRPCAPTSCTRATIDCNAFLGGISKNYGTNYILSDRSDFVVIEADEFDRSFHWLRPWMTVITATDPDHLDIYGTKEAYLESFRHYTELIQPGGALIIHRGLEMQPDVQEGVRIYDYSLNEGDFHAENIRIDNGEITFDFISPIASVNDVQLGQPVPINIENGIAAMAMAQLNGCTAEELRYGMRTYHGVDRRFDFKLRNDRIVFLSDYAHHPKEIYQSARSMRELYRNRRITAIFQPHLYTRTRDFYRDFADSLSLLDQVVLTEIYPAREQPIEGVTSQLIYDNLKPGVDKMIIRKDDVLDFVRNNDFDVLIVLGAGDLDNTGARDGRSVQEYSQNRKYNHNLTHKIMKLHINWKKTSSPVLDILLAVYLGMAMTSFNQAGRDVEDVHKGEHQHGRREHQRLPQCTGNQAHPARPRPLSADKPMSDINPRDIEETAEPVPFVKTAECYKTQNGHVNILVTQRLPIVRIKSIHGDDYYVDDQGGVMASMNYTSDLIIATGYISESFARTSLACLAEYIMENEFWKNQVVQINVMPDAGIELVPRVGDHVVFLGYLPTAKDKVTRKKLIDDYLSKKLERLEKFYRFGLSQAGWNKYHYISLEFDNQIICKKNVREFPAPEPPKPVQKDSTR